MNILITGGASGLGRSIVEKLALKKENKIFFTYANSSTDAAEIMLGFTNTEGIRCDFTNSESISALTNRLPDMEVDVLVNNALTSLQKIHFHKMGADAILKDFMTNIIPTVRITQTCILLFRKKKFGKIINIISSSVINKPPIGWSVYVANKAYLLSLSKSWATENARFNITSNSVSPAFMQTKLNEETDSRIIEEMLEQHPLKKLLTPDEVAEYIEFLTVCSQQINGTNLMINAGSEII